nr:retrovirus-related Pol polyprotein from transposon TNT 1-94 [Tanacetum cinerariifolium]
MPSKGKLYNGRKGIGFENPSYFCKAKELRPSLYDERVIGLGYTPMFLIHSKEALEIEKFQRAREIKIELAYDYGNLSASYVNEKINFSDDYFQEIINPDFEKIDYPFQQTSSLKPYVLAVILEKIIIDLEDEVVILLEKEKENLEIIESFKSKGFESSENSISKLENQSKNDCQEIAKGCDNLENSKIDASCDVNDFFVFDDVSIRKSQVSKMPFRKKPRDSLNIVQIYLWIIDSGCSKHMTGNRDLLTNFMEKFLGTVRFDNNDFAVIVGYGDIVVGSMTIKKVYYVEDGVDLLTDDSSSNLYTIALNDIASNSSDCIIEKASSSQSWLWHQRLSHLNFFTINNRVKNNLVRGLPKMKFKKDHLCSACEQGKIHRKHHKSKIAFASNKPLYLLHMDLCSPMRVESINGKRYVLVFDDYSCIEPANVVEALKDADWVSAMQDELDQFARLKVWRLVPRPEGKTIIKTKRIFKNKKDESIAQIEVIRLFLAYAAHKDCTVFQIDVKMAFLNGILKEEVYVGQPLGFVSKQYPDHVYAPDKALYGLKQAPRAWYDILSKILIDSDFQKGSISTTLFIKKKGKHIIMENCDTVPTPMVEHAKLKLDLVGKPIDHIDYRSMIVSLMYLTSSRPDIMFGTCDKLVCWSSKKQNCVSISTAESEYVAVSGCCA